MFSGLHCEQKKLHKFTYLNSQEPFIKQPFIDNAVKVLRLKELLHELQLLVMEVALVEGFVVQGK